MPTAKPLAATLLVVGIVTVASPAAATCFHNDDGSVTCCAGSAESCSTTPAKKGAPSYKNAERGHGALVGVSAETARTHDGAVGVHVGWRHRRAPSPKTLVGEAAGYGALCAPILCAGIGFEEVPSSALLGDELGIDVGISRRFGDGDGYIVTIQPIARASAPGRIRTASLLGAFVPEAAIGFGDSRSLTLVWYPFPIEVLATQSSRISVEAGIGARVYDSNNDRAKAHWKARLRWSLAL